MSKPRIALILSTTRETRFADKPAAWIKEVADARDDLTLEIVDLRDFDLPFFAAPASDLWMPATDPKVIAWQEKLAEYDGYVFLTAEYNHSIPGELKNALDQAYMPFVRKPMAAFGYGSIGGARAVEHLRGIAVELQMVPVRGGVNLGASDFFKVHPLGGNGPMSDVDEVLRPSATAMFDDLVWWANALTPARAAS
ncbi:NADPH-dependent FMN reductase [Pseudoroseicyclus sp. H15]